MQKPSPNPDTTFAQLLQDLPPETIALAREFKAFTRARKIKSPAQLLRAVLLFAGVDFTTREVAADLLLSDASLEHLTDQAVRERLQAAQPWLQALLPKLIAQEPLPALPSGLRLLVIDASDLQAPGESKVSWRLHVVMDLVSLQLVNLQITDRRTGETLRNYQFAAGEVVLADRGYSHLKGAQQAVSQGAELIIRYNAHQFPVQTQAGEPLNLAAALQAVRPGQTQTLEVSFLLSEGQTKVAWIHAYRLSGEAAAAARRRCKREGQKGRYTPSQRALFLSEFVLVLTTVEPAILSAETVLELYRCRWQVELLIKRWKSLLHLGQLRARVGSQLGAVWIYGKLIYALLLERRLRRRCGLEWGRLDAARDATWWRLWKLQQQELQPLISGVQSWRLSQWQAALRAVTERGRKRKLQTLPAQAVAWLHQPQEEELARAA